MKVRVFLNRTEDADGRLAIFARFGSQMKWQPEDVLEEVIAFDTDKSDLSEVQALAWEMFNRGAPRFVGDYMYPHRSLSVGDVIEVGGRRFWADSVGWVEIVPIDNAGHYAEVLEARQDRDLIQFQIYAGEESDLAREAHEEMEAEGAVVVAEESWFGGFSEFIDGHGNGSGRGW